VCGEGKAPCLVEEGRLAKRHSWENEPPAGESRSDNGRDGRLLDPNRLRRRQKAFPP
jgi:hypothetical protein